MNRYEIIPVPFVLIFCPFIWEVEWQSPQRVGSFLAHYLFCCVRLLAGTEGREGRRAQTRAARLRAVADLSKVMALL